MTSGNASNEVLWGISPSSMIAREPAATTAFTGNGWTAYMNHALISGLAANTTYYYVVGSTKEGHCEVFSFVNEPKRVGGDVYAIWADFGEARVYRSART